MLSTAQDLDIDITNLETNEDSLSSLIGIVDSSNAAKGSDNNNSHSMQLTKPSNKALLKLSSGFSVLVLSLSVLLTIMYSSTVVPINSESVLGASTTGVVNSLDNEMLMTYITNALKSVALDKIYGILF